MTASADAAATMSAVDGMPGFMSGRPLLSTGRHFSTGDYHLARRHIERNSSGLFDLSLRSAREFRRYDVRSARLGETLFSLVQVDSVSGYDIEMMDNPDLVLLHILMRGNARLWTSSQREIGLAGLQQVPPSPFLVALEGEATA